MSAAAGHQKETLLRAIAANPRDLPTYCALVDLYRAGGERQKAEMTLRRVLEIDPMYLRAWTDLGIIYGHREDWRSAADAFERACVLEPGNPANRMRLGAAALALRDIRAARHARDHLLAHFPERWEGHLLAGHLCKIHGEAEAAAAAYRRALDADPRQTDALYNLVDLSPPPVSDPLARQLLQLRADSALSNRESANVLFSLARIYEQSGDAGQAIDFYHGANRAAEAAMQELGVIYDPQRMEAEAQRIIDWFGHAAVCAPLPPLDLDMRLVFVTGMPRSGTTLVERIIGSHSAVVTGGELPFMQTCLARLLELQETPANNAGRAREEELNCVMSELREQYLDGLFDRDLEGQYVVDKLPANFSAIGLIRVLFPDALIIHCRRDPIATCWSLYSAHFGMHLPYNASLKHLAHYYSRFYLKLMQHWQAMDGESVVEVDYESLVTNPETEIRSLLRRCALPWEDRCLAFHENDAPVFTANMVRARQPISTAPARRWRKFETYLAPLAEELAQAGARR